MATLYVSIGAPGVDQFGAMQKLVKDAQGTMSLVNLAAIRARLRHEEPGHREDRLWSQVQRAIAREQHDGYDVALVGGYVSPLKRRTLVAWAKSRQFTRVVALYYKVSLAQCLVHHGADVTDDEAQRWHSMVTSCPPSLADGFDEVIVVDSPQPAHRNPTAA